MSEENQNVTAKPAVKALTDSTGSALTVSACKDEGRVISVERKGPKKAGYHVVIDGLLAMRMGIRPGEWWEASHFFGDDESKDGLAAEIQRPVKQLWHKHEGGGEMRVSFDILLFRG